MAQDTKLRTYLVGLLVSAAMSIGGVAVKNLYARVDEVETKVSQEDKDNAVIQKDLEDFRQSFEEFKHDVKQDIDRHHR